MTTHPRQQIRPQRGNRRGIVLVEMVVTLTVLAICLGMLAVIARLHLVGGHSLHRRAMAIELATNVLEEYRAKSWDELVPGEPQQQSVPEPFADWFKRKPYEANLLSEGEVWVRITAQEQDGLPCRRIAVEVRWGEAIPERTEQVELVTFRCRRSVTSGP